MGLLNVRTEAEYQQALRQLFPRGPFWDEQFADPSSDLSQICSAKARELTRFKGRRANLLEEGFPKSATELIANWERGVDVDNSSLTLVQRRQALSSISLGTITGEQLAAACTIFGASLDDLIYPYTPAFFGRSRFTTRLATGAALSTVWIYMTITDSSQKAALKAHLETILLGNMILSFFFKEADGEYHVS